MESTGTEKNSETITECSERKTKRTTQIYEIKESQDSLNKKQMEMMTIVKRMSKSMERMNDDIINLKKSVTEGMVQMDEDMRSLEQEWKSYLKS